MSITNGNSERTSYRDLLNLDSSNVMAVLTIPKLGEELPVYHGSTESVHQSGIGHLEYTSLPVGGSSTHAALSGHRGLPSKQLFTDLDQMEVGDVFYIDVLGERLAYQVDQIKTVLPDQVDELRIIEGEDYVTLVTCTPYGINTHRLLVRGTRIPYKAAAEEEAKTGWVLTQTRKELLLGLLVILIYLIIRWILSRKKKKKQEETQTSTDPNQKKELDESAPPGKT